MPFRLGAEEKSNSCQLISSLQSSAGEDFAAVGGLHSLTETAFFIALFFLGLVGSEHDDHPFGF